MGGFVHEEDLCPVPGPGDGFLLRRRVRGGHPVPGTEVGKSSEGVHQKAGQRDGSHRERQRRPAVGRRQNGYVLQPGKGKLNADRMDRQTDGTYRGD